MHGLLVGAWRYRFFIYSSIKTELQLRFIRSRLGGLWMVLNPLFQVLIFVFVLSSVMAAKLPGIKSEFAYAIYLMSGMLFWSLFSEILNRATNIFIENGNLLKKISFPKIALPLIMVGSALFNNILLLISMIFIFGFLGHWPGVSIIALPILIVITVAFALGIGLILGVLNVFMRDIGQVMPVILQIVYWFTPIVYVASMLPENYQHMINYNPFTPIAMSYQDVLLYGKFPNWVDLGVVATAAFLLLALSLYLFRKASAEMVDQL